MFHNRVLRQLKLTKIREYRVLRQLKLTKIREYRVLRQLKITKIREKKQEHSQQTVGKVNERKKTKKRTYFRKNFIFRISK